MYSPYKLNSDILFGAHPTHSSYQITPRSMSPRDRYYHALAEARAVELEMLEESVRREEALLQHHLQGLRQARVKLRLDPPYEPYLVGHTSIDFSSYSRSRLETLRLQLQEEEQSARLEALRRNLLELQGGRLKDVVEDYPNSRGLSLLEEVGLLHKLGISKQVGVSHTSPVVTNEASIPISTLGGVPARSFIEHPQIKHLHGQKPNQSDDLATLLSARRLRSGMFADDQTEQESKPPFQPRMSHQNEPPIASATISLNRILEQSGISALKNETHPYEEAFTHQTKGTNKREEFSGIQSRNLAETHLFSKAKSSRQEKHEKHSPASQSLDANLREQLEKRLNAEHENEVRDTIEAALNSLYDIRPAPAGGGVSSTPSLRPSAKGKEKEYSPSPESKKLSSSEVADNARLQIKEIEKQFYALEREFIFPTSLDFITPIPTSAGSIPVTSYLSFTASNQSIRFFEHSLSQLLNRLDLIESQGNEELRNKRKDVVQKVEYALENLENGVEERLKAKLASESNRRSVTVEDVTSPDEHLGTEVVPSSSRIDAKTDGISGSPHPTPPVVGETAENSSSPSTQVPIGEPTTTPNLDEESLKQNLGNQEYNQQCIAAESHAQEALLQIVPSDVVPLKTGTDSPAQPPISLELESSEPKEVYAAEGHDSNPNITSVEPADQIQAEAIVQEPPSTEFLTAAAAVAGLSISADLDTWTQDEKTETERKRLSDEETSDLSDVESASSDWSEVDVAVAR